MMIRAMYSALFGLLLFAASAISGSANPDTIAKVRELYAAAAYEDALAAMAALPANDLPELNQYRAFCLIALGDESNATSAILSLLAHNPRYEPDPAEISPRVVDAFRDIRQRVLPTLARNIYLEGKAALERRERAEAIAKFENVLGLTAHVATHPELEDLNVLAEGFLELSRALPEPKAVAPEPSTAGDSSPATPAASPGVFTRPIALEQNLPRWNAPDPISRRTAYHGILRVQITPEGTVQSAEIIRRTHPVYDGLLLRAARGWLYEPARRDGVPVGSEVVVEVHLRPQN